MAIVIIGILSGILAGMAVGGGTLLIPALDLLYDLEQQQAQAITLVAFLPIAIVAIATHVRHGHVQPRLAFQLSLGGVVGAIAGSLLAAQLPSATLRMVFAVFLILMGIYEIVQKPADTPSDRAN
ncbi:sulfite exporter TauE/SafE family protein [Heliophilum fasciatum]|uniref:Probable membrane transporter protein n=1 Tax=Heliophilum fasciatum TaxID=35700 RepID=A0A4R2RV92_9FIRM|nr:sulfite exporter TauE/SafE family protein [Heliophilum fasciatum]MCW2277432.1 putative membrane protein YfcA [Heliophilum fasciatum]TCP67268.1 hypothetical protein EDD73_105166 [Heliophilum fasciatum]